MKETCNMKPNQNFDKLLGRYISSWVAIELAIKQDIPIAWANDSCVILQFFKLEIQFFDKAKILFYSDLDNEGNYFNLYLDESALPLEVFEANRADFLRGRVVTEFPTGRVDKIETQIDYECQTIAVTLTVGDRLVVLSCGEVTLDSEELKIEKPQNFILAELQLTSTLLEQNL